MLIPRSVNQVARSSIKLEESGNAIARYGFVDPRAEPFSLPPEKLDDALLAEGSNCFQRRRQRVSFRAVRGGQKENSLLFVIQAAQLHNLAFARERRNCETISHCFAEGG